MTIKKDATLRAEATSHSVGGSISYNIGWNDRDQNRVITWSIKQFTTPEALANGFEEAAARVRMLAGIDEVPEPTGPYPTTEEAGKALWREVFIRSVATVNLDYPDLVEAAEACSALASAAALVAEQKKKL